MTLDIQTKPRVVGPDSFYDDSEWLAIRGTVIVASFEADCIECAWGIRDELYPSCQVAMVPGESYRDNICIRDKNRLLKLQREGHP